MPPGPMVTRDWLLPGLAVSGSTVLTNPTPPLGSVFVSTRTV